jgi:hypothetical protein
MIRAGIEGLKLLSPLCNLAIIVDVLSFSTCVDIAVLAGAGVIPYRFKDDSVFEFSRSQHAVAAALVSDRCEQLVRSCLVFGASILVEPIEDGEYGDYNRTTRFEGAMSAAARRTFSVAAGFGQSRSLEPQEELVDVVEFLDRPDESLDVERFRNDLIKSALVEFFDIVRHCEARDRNCWLRSIYILRD